MTRTSDRDPGEIDGDENESFILLESGADPTIVGQMTLNTGALMALDIVGVFDLRSGAGISEAQHEDLDTLVHEIAESSFDEFVYTGNRVDNVTTWQTAAKLIKVRETALTYSANKVTQSVTTHYDGAGVAIAGQIITEDYVYSGNKIDDVTRTQT